MYTQRSFTYLRLQSQIIELIMMSFVMEAKSLVSASLVIKYYKINESCIRGLILAVTIV